MVQTFDPANKKASVKIIDKAQFVDLQGAKTLHYYMHDGREWVEYNPEPASRLKTPFAVVVAAEHFVIGPAGYAGTITREEEAFREILKNERGGESFVALLSTGTRAGQMYALLGLKLLDDPGFKEAYARVSLEKATVSTMDGCIVQEQPIRDVASAIRSGKYK